MDDIVSSPLSPNPRKRPAPDEHSQHSPANKLLNLKGTQFVMPTPPDTDGSSNASPKNGEEGRAGSPAPSSSALSSIQDGPEESTANATNITMASSSNAVTVSNQPPRKRRKLSPSEKIEQQRVKEAKAAEKAQKKAEQEAKAAEEKQRKETLAAEKAEKKALVDDQKRQKAEDKEQKKREKEVEEERKAQAKLKAERKQMRLMNFLKPATPAKSPAPNDGLNESEIRARRRSLSLETYDNIADQIRSASPVKGTLQRTAAATTPSKPPISDYRKHFLPFDVQTYITLAPSDSRTPEEREFGQAIFDSSINDDSLREKYDLGLIQSYADINEIFPKGMHVARGHEDPMPRVVIEKIQASSSSAPIDLTNEGEQENPLSTLQTIPYRYLHFAEDVRPPYYGSYSKYRSLAILSRLRRNPFTRITERKDTDYDYDSEAEWDEAEEGGEDLDDDDEMEKDEDEDEDEKDKDKAFLDDEDDVLKDKRRLITGDLIPVNTGLCWADEAGKVSTNGENDCDLNDMRIGFLLPGFTGHTIDPFSTSYWEHELMPPPGVPVKEATTGSLTSRPPLKERHNSSNNQPIDLIGAAQGEKGPITSAAAATSSATHGDKRGRKPSPKTLSKEDLDEFKNAVVGSGLGKIDLCKGLKTRFPKLTMEAIKETLGSHFAQVGLKREDKKWRFVEAS